jgi:2-oxo-4-hydroxy-4-carboxy-5-ureidoimidazoline decarboxylase
MSAANDAWNECNKWDWREAFSHHPRIGANVEGREAAEQAGAQAATSSVRANLAWINRAYEERFGHIYIVCASGKTAEEMLSIAIERLDNDPDTELRIAAEEQRKIMQLRLRKLLS